MFTLGQLIWNQNTFSHCHILHIQYMHLYIHRLSHRTHKKRVQKPRQEDVSIWIMWAENKTSPGFWRWDGTPWAFIHKTPGGWTELNWETLTQRILAHKHNTLLYSYSLVYSQNTQVNILPKQYGQAPLLRNCFRTMRALWDMGYCWGTL